MRMRRPRVPTATTATRRAAFAIATLAIVAVWQGCTRRPAVLRDRPVVVVSVLPQAYFVERIAEGRVAVEVMIPPGASPATHEPGMKQMMALSGASLFVKVGHGNFALEKARLDRVLESSPGLWVVDGSQGIPERPGDPHTWVAPASVRIMARTVADALTRLLPEDAAALQRNLDSLLADIDAVQGELDRTLSGKAGRRLFLLHDAWGYLLDRYGIEQVAVEVGGRQPDPAALAELVRAAKADGAMIVFVQPQMNPAPAQVLANEIGARLETVDPLARDWVTNMRHVAALFGEALRR